MNVGNVYYLPSSGHCCACSRACWHVSPPTYCGNHGYPLPYVMWPTTTTAGSTTTFTWSTYVGRHRKGDPGPGR